MSIDRDPNLQVLFTKAEQKFDGELFALDVMRQINHERRKTLLVWLLLSVFVLACLGLLATPVITAIRMATDLLPVSLVQVETEWMQALLSPINSVAAVIALGILGVRSFFRWVFR